MGSIPPELSLEMKPIFVPKSLTQFLIELGTIGDVSERLLRLDDFLRRLEEEMKKIVAFKRELPLCMILINDAIATLKEESMKCRTREFIPLKKSNDKDEEMKAKDAIDLKDKKNWMSSVQLWNIDDQKTDKSQQTKQGSDTQFLKVSGEKYQLVTGDPLQSNKVLTRPKAMMPFGGSSVFPLMEKDYKGKAVAELSLVTPETKNLVEDSGSSGFKPKTMFSQTVLNPTPIASSSLHALQQSQSGRKQRRCWSPELHRRFVSALQQLGGSQVATPKQIRELMQVDGLTNDEVKSHLQKYRLHMRRLPSSGGAAPPNNAMVVVSGDLWEDHSGESSKQSRSQSRSPAGPLQLTGASMEEDEEGEEEKSENYTSKRHNHS